MTHSSGRTIAPADRVRLAWREARPIVQLIFLLRFAAGTALGWEHHGPPAESSVWVVVAAAGWLATTWAIYLLNGVADLVEDRENDSDRPIARGNLPVGSATRIVWVLAAVGLVCGAVVSLTMLVLVVLMLVVGWAYSMGPFPLKRTMVGFVLSVTALGLLTYLAGWYATGGSHPSGPLLLFGAGMSLWMGVGGSTKDLSDTKGDRLAGRRTLPLILGDQRARMVMAISATLLGWSFLMIALRWFAALLPIAVVLCAGSAVLSVVALTRFSHGDRTTRRRPYKAFMLTQYAAHLALLTPVVLQ